jgi:hypothetical protein
MAASCWLMVLAASPRDSMCNAVTNNHNAVEGQPRHLSPFRCQITIVAVLSPISPSRRSLGLRPS